MIFRIKFYGLATGGFHSIRQRLITCTMKRNFIYEGLRKNLAFTKQDSIDIYVEPHGWVCKKPPVVDRSGFSLNMITAPIHVLFQQQLGKGKKNLARRVLRQNKTVFTMGIHTICCLNKSPTQEYVLQKNKEEKKGSIEGHTHAME